MEITEINMISNFEAGMKCLQNPSFISRFVSISGIEKVPQIYNFWKWGALFFAIFATFSSLIRRIKLIFIYFHSVKPSLQIEDVFEFSDDDDDFSLESSDEEEEERENHTASPSSSQRRGDEDFCIKGACLSLKNQWQNGFRRRNSGGATWPEFSYGKNVVKLWDSLGLSLDFDEDLFNYDSETVVSTWDNHSGFSGDVWNAPAPAPTVVLKAERSGKGDGVILGGYDTRMRRRVPALYAEWSSTAEKAAVGGVSTGGVGKVYVRDGVSGVLTVGDVRNVRRPLENVRESNGETWWDADAVIVEDESR